MSCRKVVDGDTRATRPGPQIGLIALRSRTMISGKTKQGDGFTK